MSKEEIAARIEYATEMALVSTKLAELCECDLLKRNIARGSFLFFYLAQQDSLLSQYKNLLGRTGIPVKEISNKINSFKDTFRSAFQGIRHNIAAHQQVIDPGEKWTAYSDIKQDYVGVLATDLQEVTNGLFTLDGKGAVGDITFTQDLLDEINKFPVARGVLFNTGALGPAQPNTVSLMGCHTEMDYIQSCVDSINFIEDLETLNEALKLDLRIERLIKSLLLLELYSLIENMVGAGSGTQTHSSVLEQWRTSGDNKGLPDLERIAPNLNRFLNAWETWRNFVAHIDANLAASNSFEELLELFDKNVDLNRLQDSANATIADFRTILWQDRKTKQYSAPRLQIKGIVGVPSIDEYDD